MTDSFYDNAISGQSDTGKGTGKTTAEMKTKATTISRCLSGLQELLHEGGKDNTTAIAEVLELIKVTSTGSQLKRMHNLSAKEQ